jgi:hypothetical protein
MNATNRIAKLGFVVAMAVALSGFLGYASAAVNHVLERTYISTGALFTFFPASFASAVDKPQTITCPGTSGTCTIQADHWIEVSETTNGNESWGWLWTVFLTQTAGTTTTRFVLMGLRDRSQAPTQRVGYRLARTRCRRSSAPSVG